MKSVTGAPVSQHGKHSEINDSIAYLVSLYCHVYPTLDINGRLDNSLSRSGKKGESHRVMSQLTEEICEWRYVEIETAHVAQSAAIVLGYISSSPAAAACREVVYASL